MGRKPKVCRVCGRSCEEADPVNEEEFLAWGYAADSAVDENGIESVSGKIDWYCQKNNELNHMRTGVKLLHEQYEGCPQFKEQWELDRDSLICMAAAVGPENIKKAKLKPYKEQVIASSSSSTKRGRSGFEYTPAVFETLCKDDPDLKKRAETIMARVRSAKGFRFGENNQG